MTGAAAELIYLVSCAVNGAVPDAARVRAMDLPAVYRAAERQMLAAAAGAALSAAGVHDPDFAEAYGMAVRKSMLQNAELTALRRELEAAKIWYLPLKGAVLQRDYPRVGLRQMSDVDVLIDPARAGEVRAIMERLGFAAESYDRDFHDVYHKPPVCSFEIHRSLFSPVYTPAIRDYYADIRARLLPEESGACGRRLSDEDLYIYLLAHGHKHFSMGGTGLRSLLDVYVFLKKHGAGLDRAYVAGELEKLGLTEYEARCRELALDLFGGGELNAGEEALLGEFTDAGAYGTREKKLAHAVADRGAARYALGRIFLPMFYVKKAYPWFYEHKAALPLLPLYRLWLGVTSRRGRLRSELAAVLRRGQAKDGPTEKRL